MNEIEKYDRAVYAYLLGVSPRVIYAPTQNAIRTISKKEQFSDSTPWSFISFFRSPEFNIDWSRMSNSAALTGDLVRMRDVDGYEREAMYVKNIPVNLGYNVELWASKAQDAQDLAVTLVSKIYMQEQVLLAPINPDGEPARFHILDVAWTDNSDIERETEIGKIYRHSMSFSIDARITLVDVVPTTKFCNVPVNIYEDYEGVII